MLIRIWCDSNITFSHGLHKNLVTVLYFSIINVLCGAGGDASFAPQANLVMCYFHHIMLFQLIFILSVLFPVLLSIAIPQLDLVISLVGALASSTLALVFPPLLEIIVLWPNGFGRCNWKIFKDILICLFGMTGFVLGTTTTVMEIIKNASKDTTAECHM